MPKHSHCGAMQNSSCSRRSLCGDPACRSALAVAPCEFVLSSANPLQRSCVPKRSRCGAVQNTSCSRRSLCGDPACRSALAVAPCEFVLSSANPRANLFCEALSLWRRAGASRSRRTLCGDPACRSALAVAPCEFVLSSANPLQRSCVPKRSRCGAVQNSSCSRRSLCGGPACRSALAVAPREFVLSSANPLRRSCVSKRSRCGVVRMRLALGEPSAEVQRVEVAPSDFLFSLLANRCWEVVSCCALLLSRSRVSTRSAPPQLRHDICKFSVQKVVREACSRSSG